MSLKYLRACTALGVVFLSVPVLAQETSTPEAPQATEDKEARLNAVQVFSRKRAESAQDIPVVVQAFDAAVLERNVVANIEDI